MDAPIVHIVDDDEAARKATERMLAAAGYAVRSYTSGDEFLATAPPDATGCLLLDMRMPGRNGLELQSAVAQREDPLPVIFLTGYGEVHESVRAMRRGAIDFLTKPIQAAALLDAVARALDRDASDRAARARQRDVRARYERLTPREREVFAHLISGQLNKQVAGDLNISERTVKLHRARIFEKLEVDSMAALARLAIDLGIDPPATPQTERSPS
jgi:FixJ family two-component response regulator